MQRVGIKIKLNSLRKEHLRDIEPLVKLEREKLVRLNEIRDEIAKGDRIDNGTYSEFLERTAGRKSKTHKFLSEMGFLDYQNVDGEIVEYKAADFNKRDESGDYIFPKFKEVNAETSGLKQKYQEHFKSYYDWKYAQLQSGTATSPEDIQKQKLLIKAKLILDYLENRSSDYKDSTRIKKIKAAIEDIEGGDLNALDEALSKNRFKKYNIDKYRKSSDPERREYGRMWDFIDNIENELNTTAGGSSKLINFINRRVARDYLLEEKRELNEDLEKNVYPTMLSLGSMHEDIAGEIYRQRREKGETDDGDPLPSNYEIASKLNADDFLGEENKKFTNGVDHLDRSESPDPIGAITPNSDDFLEAGVNTSYYDIATLDNDDNPVVTPDKRLVVTTNDDGTKTYDLYEFDAGTNKWEKADLPPSSRMVVLDDNGQPLEAGGSKVLVDSGLNLNEGTRMPGAIDTDDDGVNPVTISSPTASIPLSADLCSSIITSEDLKPEDRVHVIRRIGAGADPSANLIVHIYRKEKRPDIIDGSDATWNEFDKDGNKIKEIEDESTLSYEINDWDPADPNKLEVVYYIPPDDDELIKSYEIDSGKKCQTFDYELKEGSSAPVSPSVVSNDPLPNNEGVMVVESLVDPAGIDAADVAAAAGIKASDLSDANVGITKADYDRILLERTGATATPIVATSGPDEAKCAELKAMGYKYIKEILGDQAQRELFTAYNKKADLEIIAFLNNSNQAQLRKDVRQFMRAYEEDPSTIKQLDANLQASKPGFSCEDEFKRVQPLIAVSRKKKARLRCNDK
ncbi:hypothetical protein N9N67_11695 [Bacteriovoracaceae bacterium]|nr:hypothetical protein [Bacteriovoracaceae bacterium]